MKYAVRHVLRRRDQQEAAFYTDQRLKPHAGALLSLPDSKAAFSWAKQLLFLNATLKGQFEQ